MSNCALDNCRRPSSGNSPYCWFHKFNGDRLKRRAEAEAKAEVAARRAYKEEMAKRSAKDAKKRRQRKRKEAKAAVVTRKRNAEAWKKKEPKLRAIAEEVFSEIESFTIDLDGGTLRFTTNGMKWHYDDALSRSYASLRSEMEEDKNQPDQTAWEIYSSGPRCRYCGTRVAKWTYLCCVSCDDDEC